MEGFQRHITQYSAYFGDLQRRLLLLVKIFLGVLIVGFFATTPLVKIALEYVTFKEVSIVATSPFQLLDLAMSAGMFFASVVTTPFFVYHLYAFLSPGLLPKERRLFISLIPLSLVLFFLGFFYGFGTMYYATEAIAHLNITIGIVNYWDIGRFISQIVLTASLLGIIFEFPIVITFLIRIGAIGVQWLRSKRKHAVVVIFIFVSLLPPTDGLSLILMASPMVLIYELTILVNSQFGKYRRVIIT